MADISREIAEIELASRGEEVRDSIVDALNSINDGINYINPLHVTLLARKIQEDSSTAYGHGWIYDEQCTGVTASTYAIPCLTSLSGYIGRYAVESVADGFRLHFDSEPSAGLGIDIYYFSDGDYPDGERQRY